MTKLGKLSVSLTKHGAHKIALLLKKYEAQSVLDHLHNSVAGVNIEAAQAKKNLSVSSDGHVPEVWNKAKMLGEGAIDALVLVAIIFSHSHLIQVTRRATNKTGRSGTIKREAMQNEKAFTNFAHTIEELGFSTEHTPDHVRYDLTKLFEIEGLNVLIKEILTLKLVASGWDRANSLIDELTSLGLHEVFSLSTTELGAWLGKGRLVRAKSRDVEDVQFFFSADDDQPSGEFQFRAGHRPRKTGAIGKAILPAHRTALLLHNEIQTKLYEELCKKFGSECVGTEISTGDGTSIDVVVKTATFCYLYEIKTDSSVKGCIRQAIPQLLEYAYWRCDAKRAQKLYVVSPAAITNEAKKYLAFLRTTFKLPFYYEQIEL